MGIFMLVAALRLSVQQFSILAEHLTAHSNFGTAMMLWDILFVRGNPVPRNVSLRHLEARRRKRFSASIDRRGLSDSTQAGQQDPRADEG
jgi:hypothetical protein